jgi:hypothetical protein
MDRCENRDGRAVWCVKTDRGGLVVRERDVHSRFEASFGSILVYVK